MITGNSKLRESISQITNVLFIVFSIIIITFSTVNSIAASILWFICWYWWSLAYFCKFVSCSLVWYCLYLCGCLFVCGYFVFVCLCVYFLCGYLFVFPVHLRLGHFFRGLCYFESLLCSKVRESSSEGGLSRFPFQKQYCEAISDKNAREVLPNIIIWLIRAATWPSGKLPFDCQKIAKN